MDYVKDGTLTVQARTIKEVKSIDRVVVYADGYEREYLMPLPEVRKEGEWIPVEKRLPSDGIKVLVTRELFDDVPMVKIARFSTNLHDIDPYDFNGKEYRREGFFDYDSEWGYYEVANVLAWMPLPEPWKGE